MEQLGPHMADLNEIWYLSIFFRKNCLENSNFIKSGQEKKVL